MTSLVFPAYNPGAQLERTFAEVRDFLRTRPEPWEVIFVLDGCTDASEATLAELLAETGDSRFRTLSYSPNRGKGYAVRQGLLAARGNYRIFTDVDLAYRLEDVARIAGELAAGADVAIASRDHPNSQIQLPVRLLGYAYRRRLQSHVFGRCARWLLPLDQRDTQAGLKGMTATVAQQVLPHLVCDGFGFDCEFLTACRQMQIPVTEVPICVRYEDAMSTTGTRTMLRMMRELWRIRRDWHRREVEQYRRPEWAEPQRRAA